MKRHRKGVIKNKYFGLQWTDTYKVFFHAIFIQENKIQTTVRTKLPTYSIVNFDTVSVFTRNRHKKTYAVMKKQKIRNAESPKNPCNVQKIFFC